MGLSGDLRRANLDLWERMVTHAFVRELGDGSLSAERFRRYMLQDYAFLKDLVTLAALGIAKAPDLDAARHLDGFLSPVLNGEEVLFRRAFESLGAPADAGETPSGCQRRRHSAPSSRRWLTRAVTRRF